MVCCSLTLSYATPAYSFSLSDIMQDKTNDTDPSTKALELKNRVDNASLDNLTIDRPRLIDNSKPGKLPPPHPIEERIKNRINESVDIGLDADTNSTDNNLENPVQRPENIKLQQQPIIDNATNAVKMAKQNDEMAMSLLKMALSIDKFNQDNNIDSTDDLKQLISAATSLVIDADTALKQAQKMLDEALEFQDNVDDK